MGRQGYMTMIALGRSPYEPPDPAEESYIAPARDALTSTDADGYVQEYDARGRPVNSGSKKISKQLRKAKNDILSTMGIVVSGEDRNLGSEKERKKVERLARENTYGVVLAGIDQNVTFFVSWWTSSLASRMMAFNSYTHVPLMDILHREVQHHGRLQFSFSGIPSASFAVILSIWRYHYLNSSIEYVSSRLSGLSSNKQYQSFVRSMCIAAKISIGCGCSLVIVQTYIFSLLQCLHLIPASAIPTLKSFLPFGPSSLLQLPPIPTTLSAQAVWRFMRDIALSPFSIICLCDRLRPLLEPKIYRLIRRHLPKPDRPDWFSVKVSAASDLIQWTIPALGKNSEEELRRSNLSLLEDIMYEIELFKNWFGGLIDRWLDDDDDDDASTAESGASEEPAEFLISRVAQLRREMGFIPDANEDGTTVPRTATETIRAAESESTRHVEESTNPYTQESQLPAILSGEEQRFAQSPLQLREDYFPDMTNIAQTEAGAEHRPPGAPFANAPQEPDTIARRRPRSRASTLFSRPSSPDSSPLASPRVRASLVHQNSDVVTMQLELLQSRRDTAAQHQANGGNTNTNVGIPNEDLQRVESHNIAVDRAASELVDTLLSSRIPLDPGDDVLHHIGAVPLASVTPGPNTDAVPATSQAEDTRPIPAPVRPQIDPLQERTPPEPTALDQQFRIPQHQEAEIQESAPPTAIPLTSRTRSRTRRRTQTQSKPTFPDHRVSTLSLHLADSLASHTARIVTAVLFYPFEALVVRNLASTFLSRPDTLSSLTVGAASVASLGLHGGKVRPLGAWFGGGSPSDRITYVGKMILITGFSALVDLGIWAVSSVAAVMLGRSTFNWGEL